MSSTNRRPSRAPKLKKFKKFDIKKYHIHFESIFKVPDMKKAFIEFCKTEHNTEPMEFLDAIDALPKSKDIVSDAKKILSTFIEEGSPKEINLSGANKRLILKQFENVKHDSQKVLMIFKKPRKIVALELHSDVFPRFVRSKFCAKAVEAHQTDPEVVALKTTVSFPYEEEDFNTFLVTKKDFDFMKHLAKDDFDWELHGGETSKLNSYYSDKNFLPNVPWFSNASLAKFEAIFPFDFETVCCSLIPLSECLQYDDNVVSYEVKEYFTHDELVKKYGEDKLKHKHENKRAGAVTIMDIQLPWPMVTKRKYPVCTSIDYDPAREEVTMVHKPCRHPSLGKFEWTKKIETNVTVDKKTKVQKKQGCYVMPDMQSYHIRKLDAHKTLFVQIHVFDLGGWASSRTLQKLVLKERGRRLRESYIRHMSKKPKDFNLITAKEMLKKDPFGRLLHELDIPTLRRIYQEKRQSTTSLDENLNFKVIEIKMDKQEQQKVDEKKEIPKPEIKIQVETPSDSTSVEKKVEEIPQNA